MLFRASRFGQVLVTTLFCAFLFNNFSYTNSAEDHFYKDNPWEFMEEKFVIDKKRSDTAINLSACLVAYFVIFGATVLTYRLTKDSEITTSVGIGSGLISIIAAISAAINLKNEKDVCTLKSFLEKYNPNLKEDDWGNNKLYLPQELMGSFDALYKKWKKSGDPCLENDGFRILELIREKIKYQINPQKYNKPLVYPVINLN